LTKPIPEPSVFTGNPLNLEEGIIELANVLAAYPRPSTAILDGYQTINNEHIHQAVRLLIDSLPAGAQMVVATRTAPPLQQARLRVRRELVELGLADLGRGAEKDNLGEVN
jgi:LuxR family transcriptional regulator, maltose regulon positive regulatory protein